MIQLWLVCCLLVVAGVTSGSQSALAASDPGVDRWLQDLAQVRPKSDAQLLSSFAGVVRLPRREFALFDGPNVSVAGVAQDTLTQRLTYTVELRSAAGTGSIQVTGVVGRRPELDADPAPDCLQPGPNYCADTGYVQGPPTGEAFFHMQSAGGHPGRVSHGVCCNGEGWTVQWYVPDDDTTHTLTLYLDPADRVGHFDLVPATDDNSRRLGPPNVSVAQWLLDQTDTFIGFRKGSAVAVPTAPTSDPTLARVARARIDTANDIWSHLVAADAADYNLDNWADPAYGGAAKVNLSLTLPLMRRNGQYRDAHLLSSALTGARRLADGTIEASTHEVWLDHTVDAASGDMVSDQSGEIDQTYTLGLVGGVWKVLEIRAPRSPLN